MIFVPCCRSQGISFSQKASTPGFCRPTLLRMPEGVSAIRGLGFPSRRFDGQALDADATQVFKGKILRELPAKAEGAGRHHHGIFQLHSRQVHTHISHPRSHPLPANIGPSLHTWPMTSSPFFRILHRAYQAGPDAAAHPLLHGHIAGHARLLCRLIGGFQHDFRAAGHHRSIVLFFQHFRNALGHKALFAQAAVVGRSPESRRRSPESPVQQHAPSPWPGSPVPHPPDESAWP